MFFNQFDFLARLAIIIVIIQVAYFWMTSRLVALVVLSWPYPPKKIVVCINLNLCYNWKAMHTPVLQSISHYLGKSFPPTLPFWCEKPHFSSSCCFFATLDYSFLIFSYLWFCWHSRTSLSFPLPTVKLSERCHLIFFDLLEFCICLNLFALTTRSLPLPVLKHKDCLWLWKSQLQIMVVGNSD